MGPCNTAIAIVQLLLLFDILLFDSLDLQQGLQAHDGHRHSTGLIGPTALFSASKYLIQGHGLRLSVGLHKEFVQSPECQNRTQSQVTGLKGTKQVRSKDKGK